MYPEARMKGGTSINLGVLLIPNLLDLCIIVYMFSLLEVFFDLIVGSFAS